MHWFTQGVAAEKTTKIKEYQNAFGNFVRIFSYSTLSDKIWLAISTLAAIAAGVTIPLMNVIFAKLIRTFTAFYTSYYTGFTAEQFRDDINRYVLYMIYLFIAKFLLAYISILGSRFTSLRISAALRLTYMRTLLALPVSTIDTFQPGGTAALVTITANQIQIGISEKLSLLVQTISLVISAIVIAFIFSWLLSIVTLSGLVFVVFTFSVSNHYLMKRWKKVEAADRMSASIASEAFSSIRMVAACGAEKKIAEKYATWVDEASRRGLQMSPVVALQFSPAFFAIYAILALSFWYGIRLYIWQRVASVETLLVVITSVLTIVMSVGSIAAPLAAVSKASGAAAMFYAIIDGQKANLTGVRSPEVSAENNIVLDKVNFAYPARVDYRVLTNVCVTFPAGKTTAIVGPSGSGKSTIVALLQRWYELDGSEATNPMTLFFRNGTIKSGGRDLHDIELKWWRSQIGMVQQEPVLFNETIYENVAYGLLGTEWEHVHEEKKRALVAEACREAYVEEFILRLPDAYDTQCGDAGIKLSGGQRQRIAIARSIVRKPKILILDEATSAIDVRSEQKVQAALERASQGRTTIVIAHRLSTIQKADNIIVLRKGSIAQQGPHEKLMKNRAGVYYKLVNSQQLSAQMTEKDKETLADTASVSTNLTDEKMRDSGESERALFAFERDLSTSAYRVKPAASRGIFTNFGRALVQQRQDWYWYIILFLAACGAGAAFPLQAYLFGRLISLFSFIGDYLRDQTNFWCLMTVFLAIGVGVCYFALGWASNTVSFHMIASYRKDYFSNMLRKPTSFFDEEEHSVGALSARIASDPAQIQQLLGINAASILTSIFNVVGCIIISFYFSWRLSLVIVFSAMPIIIAAGYFRVRFEMRFEKSNFKIFKDSSKFATEAIGAFRTVSALTMEDMICNRYEVLLQEHIRDAFSKAKWTTWIFAFSDSVALLCMAFALWYGGRLLSEYKIFPFEYLVVYIAIVQGSLGAGQWLSFGPNIAQASAAANRIHAMREPDPSSSSSFNKQISNSPDTPPPVPPKDNISPFPPSSSSASSPSFPTAPPIRGTRIEFRSISFTYPTRPTPVLTSLSLTIEPGQFAAIVGPSGCGKTSIINLLERFYQPTAGQILVDGKDISAMELSELRSGMSLVSQEANLISGSVAENILIGTPIIAPTDLNAIDSTIEAKLESITRSTALYPFISSLPNSYSTSIGNSGVALSGGQKQRIAIARALIREPRCLLLDEATSSLDSETEGEIVKCFEREGRGRGMTVVCVAHRLSTVQKADVIFVLGEGGQVVEKGNHRQLLQKKGQYFQMCQLQALDR